ncbi:MAG: InlB B-repeat-containing protein [Clostridia bacterium]|nr:InlB B-repeat-containing protein [Clostridia bacterium]
MKNKKLLVFLLAAVSATAVGTAACKKDNDEHQHSYTWHSSEEGHWEECVDGDDKKDIQDHVDAKNNETNADGKDGKCDVCDYALKQSVTYNMGGHGTAPDSLSVDFGATISKPADPEEDAWDFLGWYKDAAFTTAFDFTAPINDDTVIYAKWEENKNPGESKKYAIKLEVDNDGYATDTAKFGKKGVIYFSYTAVVDGRYTVSLGLGVNSAKCYFTSDKDEDGAKYGYGQTADSHVYDIHEGEKVIISLKCDEELAADAQVGIAIQATYNEPLPADSWFSGIFADSTYTLTFDRENSGIEFLDTACSYNYLGGSFDTLYITYQSKVYKLQHKNGVEYKFVLPDNTSSTLIYFAELETPIAVSALEGTYKPAAGSDNKLTQVSIGEDGECYYIFNGSKNDSNTPSFDGKYGIIYCGQYVFSVRLDGEGNVAGINVSGGNISGIVAYERTGDFVPGKLAIDSYLEFVGAEYMIYDSGAAQYWGEGYGDPTVEITNYDKATNTYTVDAVKGGEVLETYKLKIEGTGNDTVIKVYDKTGATLLDTLIKYFVNYVDLPTDGSAATMPTADFKKNFYHFAATQAGWYTINCTDANLEVYTGLTADLPTTTENAKLLDFKNGAVTVYLAEGGIVGVKSLHATKPESVSITVGLGTAPKGFVETDPYTLNGLGELEVDIVPAGNNLYVTYTPAEAGEYMINVSYIGMSGNISYQLLYTVDGVTAGFNDDIMGDFGWKGGLNADSPYYELTVADTTPVNIVVNGGDANGRDNVKVTVIKSYKAGATELEFVEGTPVDKVITATATVSGAGTYLVADTSGSNLTITASAAFTVKLNGKDMEVTNENGTYTVTLTAGTNLYVEVSAAVTFTITYAEEEKPTYGNFKGELDMGELLIYFDENKDNVTLSLGGEAKEVTSVTKNEKGFVVLYDDYGEEGCATVEMGAKGYYTFDDTYYGSCTLKAYTPVPAGSDYEYSGRSNYGNMIVFGTNVDLTEVTLTINGNAMENVTISGGSGIYTLSYVDEGLECTATLTEEWDGSFSFSDSFYGDATLEEVVD